ncbi:kinesin heavy chain [Dacryopinax primogenitus]|uniref:Kinesin-like protein n=1 Tax=Dacryopinax primogenitus (strain DJM 731) TaxID=1858805 RepID=M5G5X4_DACPD|nr:kinesin heavy chain [Dacryopinax primogenitus]EJU05661.1 kinesin heavy chain [Dacryopinax primogenitus]
MSNNIKVVCRFRPQNTIETREGGEVVVSFDDSLATVGLRSTAGLSGPEKDGFTFDRVFPMGTKQHEVFDYGVKGIVSDVINGYNGTIFAYGQTGSGKTFTMMGANIDSDELKGIIPRIAEQIFTAIQEAPQNIEFLVKCSYMEIYLERIRDLLAPQNDNLQIHEEKNKGVYVKGLIEEYATGPEAIYELLRQGGLARMVAATNMNAESSRSHSIFLIIINQKNLDTGAQKSGSLYLVDLAGSEKIGKTGATGQTLEEAKKINKSLSALGMVINALTDGKSTHVPYRDSKLTRILQESLGGNSRTTLIINCSPSSYNEAETLSTLRFGMRAKAIKNKARVNAELSPAELKLLLKKAQTDNAAFQKLIADLEAELGTWRSGGQVDPAFWVKGMGAPMKKAPTPSSTTPARPSTPINPMVEGLRGELESRPETPTVIGLEKDERDEFLRRENELTDQLGERESQLSAAEKELVELRAELAGLRGDVPPPPKESQIPPHSSELIELRLERDRISFEKKELTIALEDEKQKNSELVAQVEDLNKAALQSRTRKTSLAEGKEKKKAELMALMMSKLESHVGISDKDDQLQSTLTKLAGIDSNEGVQALTLDDIALVRRQLAEEHEALRNAMEKLQEVQEENALLSKRRQDLERRNAQIEADMEDVFAKYEAKEGHADFAYAEVKATLEAQFTAKLESQQSEIEDLQKQVETRTRDIRNLSSELDSSKGVNEELKRAFEATSAGLAGGKDLAETARELERTRKAIAAQLAEFDNTKKALMRDVQDRCEKVIELEVQLDEMREQYSNVIRNSNTKAQQKKMAILERNLEQVSLIQRQLVDQNALLKREAGASERKLITRNERIAGLEAQLRHAMREIEDRDRRYAEQFRNVYQATEHLRTAQPSARIAKPLRGGGGANPPANGPLARLQGEEASASREFLSLSQVKSRIDWTNVASKQRASWFFSASRS